MDYPRVHRPPEPTPWKAGMIRALVAILIATSLFGSVALSVLFALRLDGTRIPPVATVLPWIVVAHTALTVTLLVAVAARRPGVRRRLAWWLASIVVIVETLGYAMYDGTSISRTALVLCGVGIVAAIAAAIEVRGLPLKDGSSED